MGLKMVGCDAGPVPIIRDPVHPTIPCGYIPKSSHEHPCARPDRRLNSGDGSELFIVDRWSLSSHFPDMMHPPMMMVPVFVFNWACAGTLLMTVCV